ncbi:MAG: GntR family transcriptional regulator [Gammaproteobacteria bacterium]|nr:GntR family transcriptional regulator [Gammaproteobacteria bacterium]
MSSIDTELANTIRQDILDGSFEHGARITEAKLCDSHKVSRTPVRLALRRLEQEGMIRKGEGRGYVVEEITVNDIRQAVQVRGHLESLAARLMAQKESQAQDLDRMARAIEQIDSLIEKGSLDDDTIRKMHAQNFAFHNTILECCGNSYVKFTCNQISHLPMLASGSMVFDRDSINSKDIEKTILRLKIGNSQHRIIYKSIEQGDPVRAEGMMREHSNTMIEYIEVFEQRKTKLTVRDLVSYSVQGDPADDNADERSLGKSAAS